MIITRWGCFETVKKGKNKNENTFFFALGKNRVYFLTRRNRRGGGGNRAFIRARDVGDTHYGGSSRRSIGHALLFETLHLCELFVITRSRGRYCYFNQRAEEFRRSLVILKKKCLNRVDLAGNDRFDKSIGTAER